MSIKQIVLRLNKLAREHPVHKHRIGKLQEIRKEMKGLKKVPTNNIFKLTKRQKEGNYAYHAGGQDELQFNVGMPAPSVFRYGVAFSLQRAQALVDPVAELSPKIEKFNEYFASHPEVFEGLEIRIDHRGVELASEPARPIDDREKQEGNFIFVGKFINRRVNNIRDADLEDVLDLFDQLLDAYRAVEENPAAQKVCRICWNDKDWEQPSGRRGKSKTSPFEAQFGFGFEEWLFDTSKLIDGYHYGFVEALNGRRRELRERMDLHLFTINGDTSDRLWLGVIRSVTAVAGAEASTIFSHYRREGWFDEMKQQVAAVGGNVSKLNKMRTNLFNLKFKPENVQLLESPQRFDATKMNIKQGWYKNLYEWHNNPSKILNTPFKAGHNPKAARHRRHVKSSVRSVEKTHNSMQDKIYAQLVEEVGKPNVGTEWARSGRTRIDVAVQQGEGRYVFYEIKTGSTAKSCIRDALSQLMEYAYWPEVENVSKLVIVAPAELREEGRAYLKYLRKKFNLPVWYRYYDRETDLMGDEE